MGAFTSEVQKLYIAYFNRPADPGGLTYWEGQLAGGATMASVANSFSSSSEYQAIYTAAGKDSFTLVAQLYQNMFGRVPAAAEVLWWSNQITTSGLVTITSIASQLASGTTAGSADNIAITSKIAAATAYTSSVDETLEIIAYKGTAAFAKASAWLSPVKDAATLATAIVPATLTAAVADAVSSGTSTSGQTFTLTTGIDQGTAFTGTAGDDTFNATNLTLNATDALVGGAGTDTLKIVDTGVDGYSIPAAIVSGIENISLRNINGTAGAVAVAEKQELVLTGTATGAAAVGFLGVNTAAVAAAATATVVGDAIVTAKAAILAGAAALAAGITDISAAAGVITLTYGGAGGKGDVANLAAVAASNGITAGASNEIVKGTLAVVATGGSDTLVASNFTNATSFSSENSSNAVAITGLATGQSIGMIGNGAVSNGALSGAYASGTAATVNISGGTKAGSVTLTGGTLLSTTINSTGAANTVGAVANAASATSLTINATTNLTTTTIGTNTAVLAVTLNANGGSITTGAITAAAATTASITGTSAVSTDLNAVAAPTITISGSGAVSLGTLNAAVKTVTSTQTAGSLTLTATTTADTKITGGAGNDVITSAATLTTGFIDAGLGNDTLIVGNVNQVNTSGLAAKYTNFETLRLAGTLDVSLISGITAIETTGTVVLTGMSAVQAAAVTLRASTAATSTFALTTATGTTDVLNLKMGTGLTNSAATNAVGAVVVTGFETLNITAAAGATAATAAELLSGFNTAFTGASLKAVNLFGSAISITDAAITNATAGATFDASALTGNSNATIGTAAASIKGLTLAGSLASGSTVIGSNFIDTITIGATGAAGSTYNLGLGADAISTLYANLHTGAVYNNIDGGGGTDTLTISDGATVVLTAVDADFKGLTTIEKITVTDTTSAAQSITTGGFFDTNFKALGVTFTTASTTGAIVIDEGTFTGTNTVVASSTTGAITISGGTGINTITATSVSAGGATGVITITTLGGADKVTVASDAATILNVINTGAGDDVIVGGLGVETVTGGLGADTITGGGGADVFVIGVGTSLTTGFDIITDWNTAVADTFTFAVAQVVLAADSTALVAGSNVQTATGGLVTFATADNTFALKLAAIQADVQLDVAQSIAVFQDGGNTYVYSAGAAAGNADDQIIQLTGITGTAADVITGTGTTTITIA